MLFSPLTPVNHSLTLALRSSESYVWDVTFVLGLKRRKPSGSQPLNDDVGHRVLGFWQPVLLPRKHNGLMLGTEDKHTFISPVFISLEWKESLSACLSACQSACLSACPPPCLSVFSTTVHPIDFTLDGCVLLTTSGTVSTLKLSG